MEHMEEQVSMTVDDCEIVVADSESDSSSPPSEQFGFFAKKNGVIKDVDEGNNEYKIVENCFINGMGPFRKDAKVVAIHRISYSGLSRKARLETFRIFSEAVANKCGGDPNMKFAWYGGSKNEIWDIISHGFTQPENKGLYGVGVYLSPAKFSMDSALLSDDDDNGLRQILLCRVILGKMEQICEGSKQFHPSSEQFDSGVDDLAGPRRYIVWSSYMNSHILPSFIISFKASSLTGSQRNHRGSSFLPKSPYMSFPNLMSMLAKYLGPSEMDLIAKYHCAFRENKITRPQVIRKVRQIAGDDLLKAVIKLSTSKKLEGQARYGRSYGALTNPDSTKRRIDT